LKPTYDIAPVEMQFCREYFFTVSLSVATITKNACIHQEFRVQSSPTIQLTLFHGRISKCHPPAYKQALRLVQMFLDT